jgi:hypothetical protein
MVRRTFCLSRGIAESKNQGYSKYANIVHATELQRRLNAEESRIVVIALHPGRVDTFADKLPPIIKHVGALIMKIFFKDPDEGAYTSVFAAASPDIKERPDAYKGAYLEPVGKFFTLGKTVRNPTLGPELWTTTETFLTKIGLTVDA